jgi:hypothetical protein
MLDTWVFSGGGKLGAVVAMSRTLSDATLNCEVRSKKKKDIFFPRCVARSIFCDVCTLEENGTLASLTISPLSSPSYLLREQLPDFRAVQ